MVRKKRTIWKRYIAQTLWPLKAGTLRTMASVLGGGLAGRCIGHGISS